MFDFFGDAVDKARRIDTTTLVSLLVDKGIITIEEWNKAREKTEAVIEEEDKKQYEEWKANLGKKQG
jgi:hypothetical protein